MRYKTLGIIIFLGAIILLANSALALNVFPVVWGKVLESFFAGAAILWGLGRQPKIGLIGSVMTIIGIALAITALSS